MKTPLRALVFAFLAAGLFAAVPFAQEAQPPAAGAAGGEIPLNALYKSLAEKNHYLVAEGLTSAMADVKCGILDQVIAAFPEAADQPIAVKYYWTRPSEDAMPQKKFVMTGAPPTLADQATRANVIFATGQDFVISDPVYWTIANTNAKAVQEGDQITVTGTATDPSHPIKGLKVAIKAETYQVQTVEMDLGQARVTMESTTKDLGGKWGTDTLTINHPQGRTVVKYEHAQVDAFWLPSKVTIESLGPDGKETQPPFVFDFSNWQVNQPLPAGIF
ncbi:MAG TPA: hypothetical protein VFP98_06500 [Candidatus Polarisedimenticolia bacterium]|nr:hypothetical protein [Candidatus Polarisedimenticolia bacterium]